eukprot:TRINITY_DN66913_c0_g1_i1.p1 TRINITY_DN66913_c0_g1~~TRINITY_DN66913_c0_g1_i1.p1  ORF type:complete len:156 (+),score=19.90 TRINITY_DN66913_c0_g1_i1:222-689(+)
MHYPFLNPFMQYFPDGVQAQSQQQVQSPTPYGGIQQQEQKVKFQATKDNSIVSEATTHKEQPTPEINLHQSQYYMMPSQHQIISSLTNPNEINVKIEKCDNEELTHILLKKRKNKNRNFSDSSDYINSYEDEPTIRKQMCGQTDKNRKIDILQLQ